MAKELDLLVVGAHPDDAELSVGGTIAKCVKLGYSVGILDLTEGEMGTRGTKEIRAREARDAAKILGVSVRENLNLGDGRFEINQKNRLKVVQIIRKHRPKVLLIPHWHERHPDHVHANILAREAWFYAGLRKIETRLGGKKQEPWRPYNYFHFMQTYEFQPTFIVDITDVYQTRLEAMLAFRSQFYDPNSTEPATFLSQHSFLDFVETRLKYFGQRIGVKYGEPFFAIEPIGVDDLFGMKFFKS